MAEGFYRLPKTLWASLALVRQHGSQLGPGIGFSVLIVMASSYLADQYGMTPILGALLLGMAFNSLAKYPEFAPGLEFCSKFVLRAGVALLGARIAFSQLSELGAKPLLVVVVVLVATLAFGMLLAALLRVDRSKGLISAAAVAICGASAAMAVAALLQDSRENQKHLLCTLVGVTGLSTIAMVVYPGIVIWLGLSEEQIGIFLGASIHDVAQVFGAGHMISDPVAELATFTKMLRVTLLVPVMAILVVALPSADSSSRSKILALPPFLLVFVALMLLANSGLIAAGGVTALSSMSQYCLWLAMAALGTRTNLVEMMQLGVKPFLLLLLNTIFIAGLALLLVA